MNMLKRLALPLLLLTSASTQAAVVYDEGVSGDAPNSAPGVNLGVLGVGTSTVIGANPGNFDDDWYQFTIGAGFQLADIILANFVGMSGNVSISGGGLSSFNNGSYDPLWIGNDILDLMTNGTGAPTTLTAGTYAVKSGTGSSINSLYRWDFIVRSTGAVPVPATLALLGIGLAGIGCKRRKLVKAA